MSVPFGYFLVSSMANYTSKRFHDNFDIDKLALKFRAKINIFFAASWIQKTL